MNAIVTAVSLSAAHTFRKTRRARIRLVAGLGVAGDAHAGETVKHRSRVAVDPHQANLRQVHLIHAELHDELHQAGFDVVAGDMGENVTTRGIALLDLPRGTRLQVGDSALIEVTGLRNPCAQLDRFRAGLRAAVLGRDVSGNVVRKAGIMAVVLAGGEIGAGDPIAVELPPEPHLRLERV
jgi:MOSC domain-containing protein YiiM